MAKTLYEKVWDSHIVAQVEGEAPLIYVDRHLVHEVTSPQAFSGLEVAGRQLRAPEKPSRRWITIPQLKVLA